MKTGLFSRSRTLRACERRRRVGIKRMAGAHERWRLSVEDSSLGRMYRLAMALNGRL